MTIDAAISSHARENAQSWREAFSHGDPFRHVVIDDFFERAFAEQLLAEFPTFDPALAKNEIYDAGGKAVNSRLRDIAPSYRQLYEIVASQPFLDLIGEITGISGLLFDPA